MPRAAVYQTREGSADAFIKSGHAKKLGNESLRLKIIAERSSPTGFG
jgi:hypothetical protein